MIGDEPVYPASKSINDYPGLTKREKLAMEIYARMLLTDLRTPKDLDADELLITCAKASLRAADIFFEQLNK